MLGFGPIGLLPVAVYDAGTGTTAYTLSCATGAFTITGIAARLAGAKTLAGAVRSFTISGQSATLRQATVLAGAKGTFTISGVAALLTRTSGSLTAVTGSFTITGNTARLATARKIAGSAGSFVVTGRAASLTRGRTLTAGTGVFTTTGVAAGFLLTHRLSGSAGAFVITGRSATLTLTAPAVFDPVINIGAIPPIASNIDAWIRQAAGTVNQLAGVARDMSNPLNVYYKPQAAPSGPIEGQAYYDSALHKLRVWDGGAWQNCW